MTDSFDTSWTPRVSCLTATHGRHSMLELSLACFLLQDFTDSEIVIVNNHAVMLQLDPVLAADPSVSRRIRIFNEPCYTTLGQQRNRLLDLARGEFVRTWDDDDAYLPWSLSQGVEGLGRHPEAAAFKPQKSWYTEDNGKKFSREENNFEATILMRREIALKVRCKDHGAGDEQIQLLEALNAHGGVAIEDSGVWTGFIHLWGIPNHTHISGSLGTNESPEVAKARTRKWMDKNQDAPRRFLTPDFNSARHWYSKVSVHTGAEQKAFSARCFGN